MELTRIVFRPQAMISFTHEDIAVLMACSAAHYDGTCRAVGKPGRDSFLWGIFVMTDTREVVEEHLEFRQIDLLAKITETTPPDQRVAATALHFQFIKILHQLNEVAEPGLLEVIRDLLEWDAHLGYHDAPAWERAKAASQTNFVEITPSVVINGEKCEPEGDEG